MSFVIQSNASSVLAQNKLMTANVALGKSIERLSSGLGITHASDDPSGMAVYNKLQGQIRGVATATQNVETAVSFLQTAEGGMEVIGDMLQRMRELSVQASSSMYTATDRQSLQTEIESLKSEIDRIANVTEFNTKRLISGDASGYWSSSTKDVSAILLGASAEGNYRISVDVKPGQNAIYKSNILIKEGDYYYGQKSSQLPGIRDISIDGTLLSVVPTSSVMTSATLNVGAPATYSGTGTLLNLYADGGGLWSTTSASTLGASTVGDFFSMFVYNQPTGTGYPLTQVSSPRGEVPRGMYISVEFQNISTVNPVAPIDLGISIVYADDPTATVYTANLTVAAFGSRQNIPGFGDIWFEFSHSAVEQLRVQGVQDGDKFVQGLFPPLNSITGLPQSARLVTIDREISAGSTNLYEIGSGQVGVPVMWDGLADFNYNYMTLDENKNLIVSQVKFSRDTSATIITMTAPIRFGSISHLTVSEIIANDRARTLNELPMFTNSDGYKVLDITQTLSIYGNGKRADVFIEGSYTLDYLANKIARAISEELGMSANGIGNSSLAHLVTEPVYAGDKPPTGIEAVKGTIIVQTAFTGKESELRFVADDMLLKALGFTQIQEAKDDIVTVTVTDAHSNKLIGSDTVTDKMLRGVIEGVNVHLAPITGVNVRYDEKLGKMQYSAVDNYTALLHVANTESVVGMSANEGQLLDISIGRLDSVGLEVTDVYVTSVEEAQKSVTKVDEALVRLSKARSLVGAQVVKLEFSLKSLNTARQNMMSSASRLMDLDVAAESANLARNQILANSSIAMLAQANQIPQLALQLLNG